MKKSVVLIIVVIVVLAGGAALLISNKAEAPNPKANTAPMDMKQKDNTADTTAPSTSNSVTIQDFAFSPANITISQGTTVTWTNKYSNTHTVTETDGKDGPKSGDLAPGKSFVFTFDKPGTYKYDCSIHPDMTGTVTVTE